MILTCPSCATKYVVKDGAIPPHGRQVRCAHCKESWHQMPEGDAAPLETAPSPSVSAYGEPQEAARPTEEISQNQEFERDVMASDEAGIAAEPVPDMAVASPASVEPAEAVAHDEVGGPPVADDVSEPQDPDYADYEPIDRGVVDEMPSAPSIEPVVAEDALAAAVSEPTYDEDFAVHIPDEEERPRGKGRIVLLLVVLIALAAAAAWFFAPASIKSKLGIAGAGKSPLELMVTTSDRQQLASGNELLAISGRVINPTAEEQAVPPIRAELRNKVSKKVVYQWTIAPPARSLPPGGSASFNSAEVDIPPGGDELTVTLANAAG